MMRGVGRRHGLAAIAQPVAHQLDLVALADDHPLAQHADVRPRAVRPRPAGNQHRLGVVRNHAGHEVDVGLAVRLADEIGPRRRVLRSQRPLRPRRTSGQADPGGDDQEPCESS